jgi:predicted Rossmann-fold nucleotide-binding protein
MAPLRTVCVFCGSRPGIRPHITEVAAQLGATLAERNIGLVYGGASVGLMGVVADAALKARMAELSDAFIMLPGGFGTYEEFMEAVTWVQLGIHDKPCGILNIDGFFDDLLKFVSHAVDLEFIRPQLAGRIVVATDLDALLTGLALSIT